MIKTRVKIEIGDEVQLVELVKKELISNYEFSSGMSGIDPNHADNGFTVKYFDGGNIAVKNSEGREYSFNWTRFKLKEAQN
jgi:hypothetical protein